MDNIFNQVKNEIQISLSEKRFAHVMRVVDTAIVIAKTYGINEEQVMIAAVAHDITKEKTLDWHLNQLALRNNKDQFILTTEPVMHSITGAYYLEDEYQVTDQVILKAIMYHTLGNPDMDDVAKVIFIADYIEPQRKQPGVEELREMVGKKSLNEIVKVIVTREIEYQTASNMKVHPDTKELFNRLKA